MCCCKWWCRPALCGPRRCWRGVSAKAVGRCSQLWLWPTGSVCFCRGVVMTQLLGRRVAAAGSAAQPAASGRLRHCLARAAVAFGDPFYVVPERAWSLFLISRLIELGLSLYGVRLLARGLAAAPGLQAGWLLWLSIGTAFAVCYSMIFATFRRGSAFGPARLALRTSCPQKGTSASSGGRP